MKKFAKYFTITVSLLIMLTIGSCFIISEKLPQGESPEKAEQLTDKMFNAINKEAWDSTKIIQWSFMNMHHYLWDKENGNLIVKWKDNEVLMNLDQYDGIVMKKGEVLEGKAKKKGIDKAYGFFCNDSFWLFAPYKARERGTRRSIVRLEDGQERLLVSYISGGVTPGDSYLWSLDENGLPESWKMWVKVLPVKGVQVNWENWENFPPGIKVATKRSNKLFQMEFSEIITAQTYEELNMTDPFEALNNSQTDSALSENLRD